MTTVYVGQIEIFAFGITPRNWAPCNGQLMSIQQNQALFSLLGTQYGGNGVSTFALPDLRGRVPIGFGRAPSGTTYVQGQASGEESHQLISTEMPQHNHLLMTDATTATTSNGGTPSSTTVLGNTGGTISTGGNFNVKLYSNATPDNILAPPVIGLTGNNVAHENRMPYLALNFCIALFGIFPSRN